MHCLPSSPSSWFNLPRSGGVAYAAQESWVQNATIRENIVFESPFDQARYEKGMHIRCMASPFTHNLLLPAIYECALQHDLELFEAGDATEVGERGLTLRFCAPFIPSHRRSPLMI